MNANVCSLVLAYAGHLVMIVEMFLQIAGLSDVDRNEVPGLRFFGEDVVTG